MSTSRLRWLVAAYPPSFRARYGAELVAVVEDCPPGWRTAYDLARGAAEAWVRPVFGGDAAESLRLRLQATVCSVFVAFSASLLGAAGFTRSVDDAPVPGLHHWGLAAFRISTDTIDAVAVVVAVAGLAFWARLVRQAVRQRQRRLVALAAAPPVIVVLWLAVSALMGLLARHTVGHQAKLPPMDWWEATGLVSAFVVYAAVTVGAAAGCVWCALRALREARASFGELRWGVAVGVVVAAGLLVEAGASAACFGLVVVYGGMDWPTILTASAGLGMIAGSSVIASVSSSRGLSALRT